MLRGLAAVRPGPVPSPMSRLLRLPADPGELNRFHPDRSQRRAWRSNEGDLRLEVADPVAGPEQLDLYRRYHAHQEAVKQWPSRQDEDRADYHESFVDNPFPTREWR